MSDKAKVALTWDDPDYFSCIEPFSKTGSVHSCAAIFLFYEFHESAVTRKKFSPCFSFPSGGAKLLPARQCNLRLCHTDGASETCNETSTRMLSGSNFGREGWWVIKGKTNSNAMLWPVLGGCGAHQRKGSRRPPDAFISRFHWFRLCGTQPTGYEVKVVQGLVKVICRNYTVRSLVLISI